MKAALARIEEDSQELASAKRSLEAQLEDAQVKGSECAFEHSAFLKAFCSTVLLLPRQMAGPFSLAFFSIHGFLVCLMPSSKRLLSSLDKADFDSEKGALLRDNNLAYRNY